MSSQKKTHTGPLPVDETAELVEQGHQVDVQGLTAKEVIDLLAKITVDRWFVTLAKQKPPEDID